MTVMSKESLDSTPVPVAASSTPAEAPSASSQAHPLSAKTALFPHLPGVYIFKAPDGAVLYVGKARDLRKRAVSYFRSGPNPAVKTRILLEKATDIEYVVTSSEKEALLLEASFIKKHRPRYNVLLRDDKNYPVLRLDPRDPYPRIDVVRRLQRDGALYFGPFPSAGSMRETLKVINQVFPLRLCKSKRLMSRERPCLNYSLGRCLGACAGKVSQEDYRKMVDEVILFLQGKTDTLQQQLRGRMEEAAETLDFERAAFYRDRLSIVASMLERQNIVSDRFLNQDFLGIHQDANGSHVVVLFVRQGTMTGQRDFDLKDAQGEPEELLAAFIQQYYGEGGAHIPDEILVPTALDDQEVLEEWLSELKGKHVRIWPVKRGDRKHLLDLAAQNACERHTSRLRWQQRDKSLLESLQRILRLPRLPRRMACVDISNIQGQHAVGGLVVFEDGQPQKDSYRHYRIEGKSEPDDPAMMAEVLQRLWDGEPELTASLDLLVLDGGKGQLSCIHQLMEERGLTESLPLISIAKEKVKDRGEKGRGFYEKIYLPGRKNPLFLSHFPDILHLLMRLRDETHRFAISYYQYRHRTELITSVLDTMPGVGEKRRQALLKHFGSLKRLQMADVEEIRAVPGISDRLAETLVEALNKLGSRTDGSEEEEPGMKPK